MSCYRDYDFVFAKIEDENGVINGYQFDSEDEMRYFLSCHEEMRLLKYEFIAN